MLCTVGFMLWIFDILFVIPLVTQLYFVQVAQFAFLRGKGGRKTRKTHTKGEIDSEWQSQSFGGSSSLANQSLAKNII